MNVLILAFSLRIPSHFEDHHGGINAFLCGFCVDSIVL